MDSIHRLRESLVRALSSHESHHDEQELFDELMVQKPRLLRLFDVGPRNLQEQKEIESGNSTINGRAVHPNADSIRQVIFLSQQLDCSEKYIAAILQLAVARNPNVTSVVSVESVVSDFHQRRRHLVDSLRFLFEATEAADAPDASLNYHRLAKFVRQELLAQDINFGAKVLKEIESLDATIAKADAARKSAPSNTVAPSGQGIASLGYDILNARYESLKYERRYLAIVLCSISRLGHLGPIEIKATVEWLSTNPNHPTTYYFLTATFLSLDPIDPNDTVTGLRQSLATDVGLLNYMTKKLEPATPWRDNSLKAAILLKWTMFLTEARHNDITLESRPGYKTDELETQVWNAVQGDAFSYLATAVVKLQEKSSNKRLESFILEAIPNPVEQDIREIPVPEFSAIILFEFETLLRSAITHASSELRKIKQRQEDLKLASARTERNRTSRFATSAPPESDKPDTPLRQDIAMLYSFIGVLYSSLPPERALQFWGSSPYQTSSYRPTFQETVESTSGRLPSFLQWAIWSTPPQDLTILSTLYDMLNGLANGQQCSELAYNFMARGGGEVLPGSALSSSSTSGPSVSWTVIFGTLESWAIGAVSPQKAQPQNPPPHMDHTFGMSIQHLTAAHLHHNAAPFTISAKEVMLARSFLRLMSTVVTHSVAVRTTISGHAQFRAIPTLLSLIPLGIPLELKGAIFDTLSAFCEAGAGAPGVEICKAVWTLMERFEVINVRQGASGSVSLATTKGVEVELEQVEAVHRLYPETIPFLKLLSTLLHTPKQTTLHERASGIEPLNTIPDNLGQPYRLPGIAPFTSFVIDNVFANIPNRDYAKPSDRWKINDLCLNFVEKSLAGFNLESLVSSPDQANIKMETLNSLLVHPGYDVMKRLLTTTPLQSTIVTYIDEGLSAFEKGFADEEPFFLFTIIRVLRIITRVLEIQDIFLDVFIPLLSESDFSPITGNVHSKSFFTRFDQILSFGPKYIPAIATYMAYPAYPELIFLSVNLLRKLSLTISPTTLVTLIQRSPDSERILAGFLQIMKSDASENVTEAEEHANQVTGAGSPAINTSTESLPQATRVAALDMLIQDTETARPYPNISHFLLFGGHKLGEQTVQDPHALGAKYTSIHAILDLINAGVPRLRGQKQLHENDALQTVPLFASMPELAERCYRVIYQLCVHSGTSEPTTRYLRSREDFFARQVARVPSIAPGSNTHEPIELLYGDGSRVTTSVPLLSSFLQLRSYIFNLVALELHVLTNKGHNKAATELLDILFGTSTDFDEDNGLSAFHELGQSPMRIIGFLQSLLFDWADSLTVEPVQLHYLDRLNLQSCLRRDADGCEIVDRKAVLYLLSSARKSLHMQGIIATPAQNDALSAEMKYVLESAAVENHRRKVSFSRAGGFEAWRRMVDLALTKCFEYLPHDRRENMLFDLLHVVPEAIRSGSVEEATSVLLSETVLSTITRLREDRQHQIIRQTMGGDSDAGSLPAERLQNIIRNVLEGILDNNHVELVRGNLYASLMNLIHLIRSSTNAQLSPEVEYNPFEASLAISTLRESTLTPKSRAVSVTPSVASDRTRNNASTLELACLGVMKPVMDRLVTTISRDAIDGTEVWKTIAFMLLDAIVQLSSLEKQNVVQSSLSRQGILSNFVRSIKDSDTRLQSVLKPDPDDLNSLYVYESKMSLFIRMAQSRAGAERLLEAQLVNILAECDYLDTRPETDQSFIDQDSFLPSAIARYHQLFMPALQVVDGILATLGNKHTTASQQALNFLSSHGSTIAILLKNEADYVSLASLEEIHLIVSLCTSVLPSVPKEELLSPNTGFGSIHLAILGLSTRCLGQGKAFIHVVPLSDHDAKLCQINAFGYGGQSKFDLKVARKDKSLLKNVVSYIGASSEFTEPEITLVLSPVTITPRKEDRMTHFSATVPTVGDSLVALDNLVKDFSMTLKQISDIGAELSNKEYIGIESAQEILREVDPSLLRDLEIEQKRSLICEEFERIQTAAKHDAKVLLDTLEMLLLLLWRHIQYYAEPRHMGLPPAKSTVTNAMRLLATSEPEEFRRDVANKIQPILSRLSSIELSFEAFGKEWEDNQWYIQIMGRRLRDTTGLHDEEESFGGEVN